MAIVLLASAAMKALVTGSSGFIGSHLVTELRRSGHEAVGVDRRAHPLTDRTLDLADVRSRRPLQDLTRDLDVVFHLAGRPGVRDRRPGVEVMRMRDNVLATRNLFDVVPLSVPVVAASSSSVYGGARLKDGVRRGSRESDPVSPRGGYAISKVEMERLCGRRRGAGGVVTVVRPFTVVGEGQRSDMALAVWTEAIRARRPVRLLGSGKTRDLTDVRDVVRGLARAAEARHDGTLNLGTGVGHSSAQMAQALIEAAGVPAEIAVEEGPPDEVEASLADTSRCRRILGFVPTTDLASVAHRVWETFEHRRSAGVAAR